MNSIQSIRSIVRQNIKKYRISKGPGDIEIANLLEILLAKLSDVQSKDKIEMAQKIDKAYRKELVLEYFGKPLEIIDKLILVEFEERRQLCADAQINGYIFRTLFDYTRYIDCFWMYSTLAQYVDFSSINLLDFGCLVSDYGFFFGKLGAHITICDYKEFVEFADYRLAKANIKRKIAYAPTDYNDITKNQDIVTFGEVLEHLKDPYYLLKHCVDNNVECIFTSCYPYGNDYYFSLSGHTREAQVQAPKCIELLRNNYQEICFENFKRLWIAK